MSVNLPTISRLPQRIAALPADDRARFERIFHVVVTEGEAVPPQAMHPWLVAHFGAVEAVCRQQIVKVTNRVTLEGALFNTLRARRPLEAPSAGEELAQLLDPRAGCDFCRPLERTPADPFGRIRGRHSLTAANVAKYDGQHAVIILDEHHPLHFTADQVADALDTAQEWARMAHQHDPEACYPFFLWNCLWRSGASILHGHAQMTLTRGMHYARIEAWRQAALRYRMSHGANYFDDLVAVYRALGLAVDQGTAAIFPSLTPFKEKESWIIAPHFDEDLKGAVYRLLRTFVEKLGVQSFNLALYQPPLARVDEDWSGFPFIVRLLDRGELSSRTSDVGAMEFFAQSVVATDPFHLARALGRASDMEEG